jgi:glucokinase
LLVTSAAQDKGRFTPLLSRIPVHVIVEPVALLGAALYGLDLVNAPRNIRL